VALAYTLVGSAFL